MDIDTRPNVVVILTDDLDLGSFEEVPEFRDELQDQGLSFTESFVSLSMCCPSRASLLRGQYAHNTGVFWNKGPLGGFRRFVDTGDEASTLAVWMQDAGYRTALLGKYLNGYPDKKDKRYIPPGWSEWFVPVAGDPYAELAYTVNHNGRKRRFGRKADDYMTDVLARQAVGFIEDAAADAEPFLLVVSTYSPHAPGTAAPRYADLYTDRQAPRGPAFQEADLSDKPAWLRDAPPMSDAKVAAADDLYQRRLRCVRAVVDLVEETVDALERTGQLDRTWIFFTSDNGFHFGEHRLGAGKNTGFDTDLRVPLVVRGPGVPAGATTDALAVNVDLAPTIAALASAPAPDWVDGQSLLPVLLGDDEPWRRAFLLEHRGPFPGGDRGPRADRRVLEPPDPGDPPPRGAQKHGAEKHGDDKHGDDEPGAEEEPRHHGGVPVFVGLRSLDWKYLEYRTGERELYDLRDDPHELDNLADRAEPGLLAALHDWLALMRTCKGEGCHDAEAGPPTPLP